jgi:hypothetical protein
MKTRKTAISLHNKRAVVASISEGQHEAGLRGVGEVVEWLGWLSAAGLPIAQIHHKHHL